MRYLVASILLFFGSMLLAQDSLIIRDHRFLEDELMAARYSKNQLTFLDSLIVLTQNERPPYKGSGERFFKLQHEKLVILHIDAGWLCRLRGNFDQAYIYLSAGERYLDSLKSYNMYSDELKNTISIYNNIQKQICFNTYQKDTTLFYAWDCAKFFPELSEEESKTDSIAELDTIDTIPGSSAPMVSHYGEIYLNDTLRFDHRFVLDSISANYFNRIKHSLLSNLSYNSFPEGMRLLEYNQPDTIIIEVKMYSDTHKRIKECSIAYANCHNMIRDYYLSWFSTMGFGMKLSSGESPYLFWGHTVRFYIPIVIKPEYPDNYNKMDKISINDDHYLIEYEKLKPLDPK